MLRKGLKLLGLALLLALPAAAQAERIKDLASIAGVRSNQLVGYGLVVGLDGTGDMTTQTPFTVQSINNMLSQMGVNMPPGMNMQLKNVAAVMVTATLPAFARPGQTLDVTVSSLGNARSLRGGTLVMTPMKGVDGRVYAMAQGNVVIGGAGAAAGGSSVQINSLDAGRVPGGATVEQGVETALAQGDSIELLLNDSDFTTANRVMQAINSRFGGYPASAVDGRVIRVRAPQRPDQRVRFVAALQDLSVTPDKGVAKVVLNARTGSIVMNQSVTVDTCAVAHGNLTVNIQSVPVISQPPPFSNGQTVVAQQSKINVKAQPGRVMTMPAGARLQDVVKGLNALGATPQDLLAILQSMKAAGALHAELEVI